MMPLTINFVRTQWRAFISAHPLIKGCISYAVLWPTGSLIQQTLEGKNLSEYYRNTEIHCNCSQIKTSNF